MNGDFNTNHGTANVVGRVVGNVSQGPAGPAGPPAAGPAGPRQSDPQQPDPRQPGAAAHDAARGAAPADAPDVSRNVFVVHGRDEQVRSLMFDFLRRLDLRPLEWEELVSATGQVSPFLGDVVGLAPTLARAAVVLLTPDDIVMLHPRLRGSREPYFETVPALQPRPNVLLELGLALGAYPERTLIVEFGELRPVADLAGRNVVRFDGSAGSLGKIAERLRTAGCPVNDHGTDWRTPWPWLEARNRTPS